MATSKLTNNVAYETFVRNVEIWKSCKIKVGYSPQELAVLLLQKLPDDDIYGGLRNEAFESIFSNSTNTVFT